MTKKNTGPNTALLAVIAVVALAGGTFYFSQSHRASVSATAQPSPQATGQPSGNGGSPEAVLPVPEIQAQDGAGVKNHALVIYAVATNDNGSHLVKKTLRGTELGSVSDTGAAVVRALDAMAEQEHSPLPQGTRARSVKMDDNGVATVDFNKAFQENFSGSDEGEALTLNAVLATVGQFSGVKRVQFLVEGRKIDSLGGNQSLTAPLPIPQDVLGSPNPSVAKSEP